jgi:DNA-binding MarR family transcriptional regulator
MNKNKHSKPLNLSWEEIGFISEGLSLSSRPMRTATRSITDEYSLGPRGAWIVRFISRGEAYPLDLTKVFLIGRSLITAELNRLTEAGLIAYTKSASDGRRVELTLTPLGEQVNRRVKQEISKLISQRLSGYTRDEVLLCARMLRDFRVPLTESIEPCGSKIKASKKKLAPRAKSDC